jgi:hypothetical protein
LELSLTKLSKQKIESNKYSFRTDNFILKRGISEKQLQQFTSTTESNEDLCKLSILGRSKYMAEKDVVMRSV